MQNSTQGEGHIMQGSLKFWDSVQSVKVWCKEQVQLSNLSNSTKKPDIERLEVKKQNEWMLSVSGFMCKAASLF